MLTLIRHAVTDMNLDGRLQGRLDCSLSEEGREQAQALGERVSGSPVDLVYSSPLKRAAETAAIAFPAEQVVFDDRLQELHFGAFQGRNAVENAELAEWTEWMKDPFGTRVPGGESYRDLRERMVSWLESLPDLPHIVAVTHSGPIQAVLAHVMGVEHPRWRKRFALRHTSLTRLLFKGDDVLIERVNDTRHVRSELDPFLD